MAKLFGCLLVSIFVLVLLIPLGGTRLFGKKDSPDSMKRQQGLSVGDKYWQLFDMHGEDLIQFNEYSDFHTLLVQTPRNYSAFVLVNFRSEDCLTCHKARNSLNVLRSYYLIQEELPQFFFIEVVIEPQSNFLRKLGIQSDNLPILLYFPEYGRLEDLVEMDYQRLSYSVKDLLHWVHGLTGVRINSIEESHVLEDYALTFIMAFFSLIYFYKLRETYIPFFMNDTRIAIFLMILIIYFVSGFMYNGMNNTAFMANTETGESLLIHPSTNDQLLAESMIVSVLYGLMTYGVILLIDFGKQSLQFRNEYSVVFYLSLGLFVAAYFLLFGIFAKKLTA